MNDDAFAVSQIPRPTIFHGAIGTAVENPILGEMIDAVAGTIEASSDKMPAIIARTAIGMPRPSLSAS